MEENVKNALDSMLLLTSSSTVRVRTSCRNIYLANLISYANRARFIGAYLQGLGSSPSFDGWLRGMCLQVEAHSQVGPVPQRILR